VNAQRDGERTLLEKNAIGAIPSLTLNRSLSQNFFQERQALLKRRLMQVLKSEEKKLKRLGEKLKVEKEEIGGKEHFKKIGELMKYNLAVLQRGGSSCVITDFEGREMNVELDPTLSPKENMDACFQRYRKLKKREKVIEDRLAIQKRKLLLVRRLIEEVQRDDRLDLTHPPGALFKSYQTASLGKRFLNRLQGVTGEPRGKDVQRQSRFLRLSSRSGKSLLVGRNAAENEELTLRFARGNDLWFHAESKAGSHVILQYEREGEFLEEDIIDAAQLALHFSALKRQGRGNILYTRCKYVRKPKGTLPGVVSYYNEKTRWTNLDEELLKKLLSPAE
jgi:predicted ribosome quality control (RQC) complex YloA/Tae2 family protein